jgi:CheY-like chemotaxis protein
MLRTEAQRSAKSSAHLVSLQGRNVLVVEDDYVLAMDMRLSLEDAGAHVVGPAGHLNDALRLVDTADALDAAVLDINLHGELVYAVAEKLQDRGVPFVFTTGYEGNVLPERFASATRYRKPISAHAVVNALTIELE